MNEVCFDILSRECHNLIWGDWGSTVSLTLSLWEITQLLVAILAIIFFRNLISDPIRRDILFGYIPTLIVKLKDRESGELLMVMNQYVEKEDGVKSEVWRMPQGVMESPDIRDEARRILKAELGLDEDGFHFTGKEMSLGRLRIKGLEKNIPAKLGFTLFRKGRGKIYKVVEVETDIKGSRTKLKVLDRDLTSINIESVKLFTAEEAMDKIRETYLPYARRKDKVAIYKKIIG